MALAILHILLCCFTPVSQVLQDLTSLQLGIKALPGTQGSMVLTTAIATSSKAQQLPELLSGRKAWGTGQARHKPFGQGKAPKLAKIQPGDPIAEHSLAAWQGMNRSASCCKDTAHTQEGKTAPSVLENLMEGREQQRPSRSPCTAIILCCQLPYSL